MSDVEAAEEYVYKWVHPDYWDDRKLRPKNGAFSPAPGLRLSVISARRQTPRGVLEFWLNVNRNKLANPDTRERAEQFFQQFGNSVQSLVENRWRVVRIPVEELTTRGFVLSDLDERGHYNLEGDYATYRAELTRCCVDVTNECLP